VFLHIERTRLVLFVDADYERGLTLAREALVLAGSRGVGEPKAELLVGTALALAGHPGSEQHLRMAWTLARAVADHDVEFRAANNLVATHENSGDPRLGRVIAAEAAVRARELGMIAWERQLRAMVANLDMLAGNYAEALDETERLLSEAVEPRTRDQLLVTRCLSLVDVGRLNEAREQIERAATTAAGDAAGRHQFTYLLAEVQFWTGRLRQAVAALDRFLAEVDDSFEIAMFARLARARAQAELGLSPDAVTVLHPIRFFAAVPVESEALRRLVAGDHDDAGAGFDEAARLWAPYHLRDSLYCTWMAGESLRRSEDSATACERFEAVEAVGVPRGMEPLVARARRSLRLCGRRRSAARRAGVGKLTGRELDVLRLVRTGSTNDEIAARLGLSRRTVETQVASATRKLGVNSRLQAAARVEEP
jgi:DNA-binding CsgD family transcriptional regulator/tetratricopeptide (TPR) repeat protein